MGGKGGGETVLPPLKTTRAVQTLAPRRVFVVVVVVVVVVVSAAAVFVAGGSRGDVPWQSQDPTCSNVLLP